MKHPPSPTISLATVTCLCGAPAVVIDPGEPDEVSVAGGILLRRGREASGRCLSVECWAVRVVTR
jgi:hypothetical protein